MKKLLLIEGWGAWVGYACYLLLMGKADASVPMWYGIVLIGLIVATAVYLWLEGTEVSS